jgi:hypothetical protein
LFIKFIYFYFFNCKKVISYFFYQIVSLPLSIYLYFIFICVCSLLYRFINSVQIQNREESFQIVVLLSMSALNPILVHSVVNFFGSPTLLLQVIQIVFNLKQRFSTDGSRPANGSFPMFNRSWQVFEMIEMDVYQHQ